MIYQNHPFRCHIYFSLCCMCIYLYMPYFLSKYFSEFDILKIFLLKKRIFTGFFNGAGSHGAGRGRDGFKKLKPATRRYRGGFAYLGRGAGTGFTKPAPLPSLFLSFNLFVYNLKDIFSAYTSCMLVECTICTISITFWT